MDSTLFDLQNKFYTVIMLDPDAPNPIEPQPSWLHWLVTNAKVQAPVSASHTHIPQTHCMCRGPPTRLTARAAYATEPIRNELKDKDVWFLRKNINWHTGLCKTPPAVLAERDVTSPVPGDGYPPSLVHLIDFVLESIALAMHILDVAHACGAATQRLTRFRAENETCLSVLARRGSTATLAKAARQKKLFLCLPKVLNP